MLAAGCVDLTQFDTDASTGAATTTTTTTGEPPGTTLAPTTTGTTTTGTTSSDTGEPLPTTGTPPGPAPIQRCQLVPALELHEAACAGADDCKIRGVMRLQCDGADFYHHLAAAPLGKAALYVETQAVPTFGIQHEAFLLTDEGSAFADMWVTENTFGGRSGALMPRLDGQIELWFQDGQNPPTIHYPPQAEIDPEGYSIPAAVRDDVEWFLGTRTRPDDVPMAYFTVADQDIRALYDLPDGRVEQPLIAGAPAWSIWLHDVAGTLKMSWSQFADDLDGTYLFVRDLDAPADQPGTPLVRIGDFSAGRPLTAVLSSFGDGAHGVVMTERDLGEPTRLIANEPWTYEEILGGVTVECPTPTCAGGCEAAPPCVESRAEAWGVALQNGPDVVRAWHLECPHDVSLTWQEDHYFDILCLCDKCRCEAVAGETVEKPCELVASTLAPDPDMAGTLLRTEQWRRPLGFERSELVVDAVVAEDTLWLLTGSTLPEPQIAIWAVDTE
ncbi:hypothetical protein SAMN02745121_08343 [Nannocystis exedens]|uniref:Uncharacterized protein n=1 Tax=Nannocystis exedens TaxID=54 RepID=A0A1I2I1H4_9BACT|nr:hypothetical protein [Nannocystis exedens]PCC73532.1 hypothetical protein NAEX_06620 [Nannocystis exedens]SFF35518.1 hypothetical protein SAMN02745121_08343 [Nannocystis exedens]